jgi:Dolichyl-phosphate-mannose-protein mannosyltransferase
MATDPIRGPERSGPWAWVWLCLLALVVRGLYLPDPWSGLPEDFHNHFGAFATGGQATNFLDQGLGFSLGMPYDYSVLLADGERITAWYTHHPAGYILLSALSMWVFGRGEWALRVPVLLFSLLAVWAVARLARRWGGQRAGLSAGFLMALVPFAVHFGLQTFTESALIACGALFLAEFLAWWQGASRRVLPMALAVGAGGLLDWPGHFFWAPAALLALAHDWRRALKLWPVPTVALLTILIHWVHVHLTLPVQDHAADRANTLKQVFTSPVPWSEYFANQARFWRLYCTWPVLLITALGALVVWRWPLKYRGWPDSSDQASAQPGDRRALSVHGPGTLGTSGGMWLPILGLLPGVFYVGLFPGRSFDHSFFGMLALPGVALLFAAGFGALVHALTRFEPRRGPVLAWLLLLALGLWLEWRNLFLWSTRRSPQIAELVAQDWLKEWIDDKDAVLLTHMGRGMCLPFYSRAQVIHSVNSPSDLERLRRTILERLPDGQRVAFLLDGRYVNALPEGPALMEALGAYGSPTQHQVSADLYGLWVLR